VVYAIGIALLSSLAASRLRQGEAHHVSADASATGSHDRTKENV
jgi:hypothetical protein